LTCPPFCNTCGGNPGHPANGDWTCAKCKRDELRKCRKERIRKDEFDVGNPAHFRLQTRGGAWRYYRKLDDPMIFVGDGRYRRRTDCSPADIDRAKLMGSAVNEGKI
jgi:hypothetical protein